MDRRADAATHESPARLSYKFQRLREQIRNAIVSGDLTGQLPGERELGKRFNANAKTVNKALCDLAIEGLVRRFIGRGTFVSDTTDSAATPTADRTVYCLTSAVASDSPIDWNTLLASAFANHQRRVEPISTQRSSDGVLAIDPSHIRALNQVDALVLPIAAPLARPRLDRPGESLVFSLARRQITAVMLGAVAGTVRTHAVVPDYNVAAFHATEYLFQLGCNDVVAVSAADSRPEIHAAIAGYQTSCARRRRESFPVAIQQDDAGTALNSLNGRLNERTGVLCLGGNVLETIHAALRSRRQASALAAVLEPGDDRARALGITACEFDPRRLAGWTATVISECGRGSPPVEIMIPGSLHLRPSGGVTDLRDSAAEVRLGSVAGAHH